MVYTKRLLILALVLTTAACSNTLAPEISPEASEALTAVPGSAKVVGFVDAASLSQTAEELVAMDKSGDAAEMWAHLLEGMAQTGMDPARDLKYAVMFASGESDPGVMLAGTFDVARIGAFIEAEMPEVTRSEAGGMTLWTAPDRNPGVKPVVALANDGSRAYMAISPFSLDAAMDSAPDPALAELAGPVLAHDAWMVARDVQSMLDAAGAGGAGGIGVGDYGMMARAVSELAVGANLGADKAEGLVILHPASNVSAKDLASLVRGAISAIRAQDMPESFRTELEGINVDVVDGVVRITGSVTRAWFEALSSK